jgi:hypothetical protein
MISAASLADQLTDRLPELELTIFTRIEAVANPRDGDPDYLVGLRATVRVGLEYALRALKGGEEGVGPIPDLLLDQARKAARNGISLDTVLRRYLAGHTILLDLIIREAAAERFPREALQELLRTQATVLDRLLAAVADEHSRALALGLGTSAGARRVRTVERLVTAEDPGPAPELRYDFGATHLALVAAGTAATGLLRALAGDLDRALLLAAPNGGEVVWAWLGGRTPLGTTRLVEEVAAIAPRDVRLAVGEPGVGMSGWRLSHRQARAAWPIARRGSDLVVRYVEVALLSSTLQDQLLVESLQKLYLEPLEADRDGGETLRRTLCAYFDADRSAASAAAILGVSRQAVSGRLRMIEERIGRPLASCMTELDTALRMRQFHHATSYC